MMKRLSEKFKKFLDTIAAQNETVYGSSKMDCCELNKSSKRSIK
ncbi:hypothetical protein EUAN_05130 [Andreesenia angusta]|uniref:Uncharacterized protein n=1 Tax=Andreesenia angusta TaxID=39480 RepID=A0A1S1VAG8_9FIRM|nr:LDCC motif putative metal-binding protein [Andreesenia angusta]OHW62729.1 hypothetical protein EUAN_05130 [Andreesenia angusta]